MSLWAIPDIHGRFDLLIDLWAKLETELDLAKDKVVYLGDMIDRGHQVADVLKFIKRQQEANPNVIVLRGNHERFMLDCYSIEGNSGRHNWGLWFYESNGGKSSHASLMALDVDTRNELVHWVSKLPIQHEEPGFFFSHAPVPRENRRSILMRDQPFSEVELTQSYDPDEFGFARRWPDKIGVCGHIHRLRDNIREPRFYDHYYFLDCGCGCSETAPLVAVNVEVKEVIYSRPFSSFKV